MTTTTTAKPPKPGAKFRIVTIYQGRLAIGPKRTISHTGEHPGGFKLSGDEFYDGVNRFNMANFYPDGKVCGLPTDCPLSMATSANPFIYCLVNDTGPAALTLRDAYVDACNTVEETLQDEARQVHALAARSIETFNAELAERGIV
jgi:hypothetical protein